ncbi:MAG: hypothetical protein OHM56_06010 [Spiroplasma phoeniceum]|nr:MAG: hypothetical protein OHM57_05415 [Spiroplasma phoeniceum]UZQ33471.1 MAG: hypothetical protein OHM56_06010 [Spiroplasma phoeniceum]
MKLQEKLFYKIQENHTWKDKYLYGNKYWKERLYSDILNIYFINLQKIIDILYKNCSLCNLQFYGWPINENKYNLDYEIYRFDNDNYTHLIGLFKFINLVGKENKCISCLQKQNKIS